MASRKTIVEEVDTRDIDSSPSVKIAVMNNDIKHINDTLSRLEGKFDTAIQSFATNQQLLDAMASSDATHKGYEQSIEELKSDVKRLDRKDAEQQGAIDANRQNFNRTLAVITLIAVILGALWWLPSLLHK